MELNHTHCLVTGAAKRVGRAVAETLLRAGASVTAHAHTSAPLLESLKQKYPKRVAIVTADLKSRTEIHAAVASGARVLGPLNALINSASIFHPVAAADSTEEDWTEFLSINLTGQFWFCQAFYNQLEDRGSIINIVDSYAHGGLAHYAPYAAAKGGLWTLTQSLAKEWAPNVRVNAIHPGPVLLPEDRQANKHYERKAASETLLGRLGTAEDVAYACRFLLENPFITGAELFVDGGRHLAV